MPGHHSAPLIDASDLLILGALALGGALWLFRGRNSDANTKKVDPRAAARVAKTPDGRSLAAKFEQDGKDMVVLYGSQTGTAEDYAGRLVKDAAKYGLHALALDPEDIDIEELSKVPANKLVIFVVATYGEGEPTDNAVALHEFLSQQVEEYRDAAADVKPLRNLHYAVFGLGNKTYELFNAMARNIDKWCTALGATRVGPCGEGDDDANMEEDFANWRDAVWSEFAQFYGIDLAASAAKAAAAGLSRSFTLVDHLLAPATVYRGELGDKAVTSYDAKNPFMAKIVATRELLTYQPGDHLAIWPQNQAVEVDLLAKALGLSDRLDHVFSLTATDPAARKKHPFPCPTTYRAAFTHYLDIAVPPKPHILQAWLPHIKDAATRAIYARLASDKAAYAAEIGDRHMTAAELLLVHPIVPALPLDVVLESFTRIQPRYYSISSSPRYLGDNARVHITATVLRYSSAAKNKVVNGLCTRYLLDLHEQLQANPGTTLAVPVAIRHAAFKLPRQNATPVIMIGPGTGVAPFRGFVQERCFLAAKAKTSTSAIPPAPLGESLLFFGCRYEAHDFLYASEWPEYIAKEGLSELITAFSRDGPNKERIRRSRALPTRTRTSTTATTTMIHAAAMCAVERTNAVIHREEEEVRRAYRSALGAACSVALVGDVRSRSIFALHSIETDRFTRAWDALCEQNVRLLDVAFNQRLAISALNVAAYLYAVPVINEENLYTFANQSSFDKSILTAVGTHPILTYEQLPQFEAHYGIQVWPKPLPPENTVLVHGRPIVSPVLFIYPTAVKPSLQGFNQMSYVSRRAGILALLRSPTKQIVMSDPLGLVPYNHRGFLIWVRALPRPTADRATPFIDWMGTISVETTTILTVALGTRASSQGVYIDILHPTGELIFSTVPPNATSRHLHAATRTYTVPVLDQTWTARCLASARFRHSLITPWPGAIAAITAAVFAVAGEMARRGVLRWHAAQRALTRYAGQDEMLAMLARSGRAVLEALPDALLVVNSRGRLLGINAATVALTGYSVTDLEHALHKAVASKAPPPESPRRSGRARKSIVADELAAGDTAAQHMATLGTDLALLVDVPHSPPDGGSVHGVRLCDLMDEALAVRDREVSDKRLMVLTAADPPGVRLAGTDLAPVRILIAKMLLIGSLVASDGAVWTVRYSVTRGRLVLHQELSAMSTFIDVAGTR
ncbi:hypothetical protein AMAG_19512 [Allomyces macrogynus ATCC 38327]|uniref:NADPH--hemoprotein reductase n=1 Tax=Allomyces macrogynus (strain ATCC 38327) TaxID=578462 RepID=A0A0L0SWL5_ALLM3|nr:hypothetical protein AMAG_19512 [Allomyces macrogynus ATCC 38327]|eukprot:KNE66785.1 hypothetical protein AMAG_19512 [Allomyces macrogynus ATCC 38327]